MKNSLKKILLNLFLLISSSAISLAQEKVTMMNGNIFFVNVGDSVGDKVKMIDPESKKNEVVDIEKSRIFSILYKSGKEVFIYKQDTLSEDNFLASSNVSLSLIDLFFNFLFVNIMNSKFNS